MDPHEHHLTFSDLLGNIQFLGAAFNFLLLVGIFIWFGRGPILSYLANRKREIEEALAEAQRLKARAEAKEKELNEKLARLDAELDAIKSEMVAAGEAERDRIVAEAESKAARIRKDADFIIDQQVKQLRDDLRREAVDAAVATAEAVLKQATTAPDQERLAREYAARLTEIGQSQANTAKRVVA